MFVIVWRCVLFLSKNIWPLCITAVYNKQPKCNAHCTNETKEYDVYFYLVFLLIKSVTFLADMEENDSKFYWKGRNPDDPQIAVKEDNMYHPDRLVFIYINKILLKSAVCLHIYFFAK